MPPVVIVNLILIGIFLVYIIGPAAVGFYSTFSRFKCESFDTKDITGTVFEKYKDLYVDLIPKIKAMPHERVTVKSEEGFDLAADFFDNGSCDTVIFVHGFSSNKYSNFAKQCDDLKDRVNFLMVEQRAHNDSGGKWVTFGIKEQYDLLKWAEWAAKRKPGKIFIYGVSMGAATAGFASDKLDPSRVAGIIMESGFKSPFTMLYDSSVGKYTIVKILTPFMAMFARIFIGIDMRQRVSDGLSKTTIPVLFIHGTKDVKVPISHSCYNSEVCSSDNRKLFIEGGQHAVTYIYGADRTKAAVRSFIDNGFGDGAF